MSKNSEEPFRRVEAITSVQRRRRWSVAEKVRLVEEAMQPGMNVSAVLSVIQRWHFRDGFSIREISRRTGLPPTTIRKYLRSDSVEPKFHSDLVCPPSAPMAQI